VVFLVALGVGAVPIYGEPITTLALIIALRWVYGRYLVRHRGDEQILDETEERSILGTDASTNDASTSNMNDDDDDASSSSRTGTLNAIIFSDEEDAPPYYQDVSWQTTTSDFIMPVKRPTAVILWSEPTLKLDSIKPIMLDVDLSVEDNVEQQPDGLDLSLPSLPPPSPLRFSKKKKPRRLFFLDNLKVFLIFLLVTSNVACAFGASDMFYFTIGAYSNGFQKASGLVVGLLQAFGVSLFYFIAGYLLPAGYERKGRELFMLKRAGNLLIPGLVGCVIVVPGSVIIGQAMGGISIFAFPHPGHFWISFWLLLLTWMYASLYDSTSRLPFSTPFPSTAIRMLAGWWICGAAMFLIVLIYQVSGGNTFFACMPLTIGSLTCNVFMFYMGVVGYRNAWLERPIRDQLDITIGWLRFIVLCEAALLVCLFPISPSFANEIQIHSVSDAALSLGAFFVSGVFCLDMSIVVLDFFQQQLNFEHPVMKGLLENAHIVYVIHPLVISFLCWAFVAFYNYYVGIYRVPKLVFQTSSFDTYFHEYAVSKSAFVGPGNGALTLFMGFQCVLILTHVFVWPLARILRKHSAGQKRKLNVIILTLLPSPGF